jgi:hypothetical protein
MSTLEIYKQLIKFHALRWLTDRQDLNVIEYLETCSGGLMSHYITEMGPVKVVSDITKEIDDIG